MHTSNRIQIASPFDRLFATAADIARWPDLLPHYRWVKILGPAPSTGVPPASTFQVPASTFSSPASTFPSETEKWKLDVIAEMAARHRGLPLWWQTVLRPRPEERRLYFTHIGGVTKGMEVYWEFTEAGESCQRPVWLVQIHHSFSPRWPLIGPWVAERIIGRLFVQEVAAKTLACMKGILEAPQTAVTAQVSSSRLAVSPAEAGVHWSRRRW
jgi:hypothetical protein